MVCITASSRHTTNTAALLCIVLKVNIEENLDWLRVYGAILCSVSPNVNGDNLHVKLNHAFETKH